MTDGVRVTRNRHRIAVHEYLQADGRWLPCERSELCRECNRRPPPRPRVAVSIRELTAMKSQPVPARVIACVQRAMRIRVDAIVGAQPEITAATRLPADLGADMIDRMTIAMEIEDEFGIDIADDDVRRMLTVGDLIAHAEARQTQPQPSEVPY